MQAAALGAQLDRDELARRVAEPAAAFDREGEGLHIRRFIATERQTSICRAEFQGFSSSR